MRKSVLLSSLLIALTLVLFACGEKTPELTSITISGADNVTLDFEEAFNVLDGVTALGNDGVDYTSEITYVTTASVTDDVLDTTDTGEKAIQYNVSVGEILAQTWRYITVNEPQAVEGEMLVNPNFDSGTSGWDSPSVVYEADGGTIVLSNDEGTLKAEVVAGSNAYTPRFGQMNVPFEEDVTYLVSFDAKSSVEKTINLQVGEILASDPWFTDFKPGLVVHKTIGTDWATYSYKFTMNQDVENHRGGLLFELGTVESQTIDATMWFDNITIEESTPDADETAPTFAGLTETKSLLLGADFDPMNGVTAFDIVDGDVTDSIAVVIKDNADQVVEAVDTSMESTYTLTYTVSDEAGNEAEFVVTLEIVGMQFNSANLLVNGLFDAALNETTPEWEIYDEAAYVTASGIDVENGEFSVTTAGAGSANPYSAKLMQSGITLMEGHTYRVQLVMKSDVARDVNVALGIPLTSDPWWIEYARFNDVALTTEYQTFEFVFTAVKETSSDIQLVVEMGATTNYADATVTFDSIAVNEALLDDIVMNSDFSNDGWTLWAQDWEDAPTVVYSRENEMFNITTDKAGEASWAIQFSQLVSLEQGKTYVLTFDAKASVARDINIKVFKTDVWVNHLEVLGQMLTTDMTGYTFEFTVPAEADVDGLQLNFELGATTSFAAGMVSFDNLSLKEKDNETAPELLANGNATTVQDFELFTENGSSMVLNADGNAVLTVPALGGAAYQPHVFQMIDSMAAGTYTLKLAVSADVARDLRVNLVLPDAGYSSILPDAKFDYQTVANDTVVVYVTFTIDAEVTNVKLELDFGTLEGLTSETGTFTIEEAYIYQIFN